MTCRSSVYVTLMCSRDRLAQPETQHHDDTPQSTAFGKTLLPPRSRKSYTESPLARNNQTKCFFYVFYLLWRQKWCVKRKIYFLWLGLLLEHWVMAVSVEVAPSNRGVKSPDRPYHAPSVSMPVRGVKHRQHFAGEDSYFLAVRPIVVLTRCASAVKIQG